MKRKTVFNNVILFEENCEKYRFEYAGDSVHAHIEFSRQHENIHPNSTFVEVLKIPVDVGRTSLQEMDAIFTP